MRNKIYLILENIRSVHNVGAIFRTADACGVSKIFLIGVTPRPIDRFGRTRKDVAKASLGAEKTVEWEYRESVGELIKDLKKRGIEIVSVEQDKKSLDYKDFKIKKDTAFVFGNEVEGVLKQTIKESDKVIEIQMMGEKESLNVSVTAGIVLFRTLNI